MKRLVVFLLVLASVLPMSWGQLSDTLRTTRPKVGLVLGGGGAKGAAHIGVLKYIEEMGIPIDYVVGTSMGSIMGGLYALGYNSAELADLIGGLDWSVYIKGEVEREYLSSADKQRKASLLLSVPFGRGQLESALAQPLLATLPSSFVNGSNLINLFNNLSVGYQDSMDFKELPIPFACVATDVFTGDEVVLRSGNIARSIRASMAIPGVFAPVQIGDKLLLDGGMANNFPVDICRAMGADIVIGVEVASDLKDNLAELQSLPQLMGQLMNIMVAKKKLQNRQMCDVYIRPDVSGYNMLSFSAESIDTLINRGYRDAQLSHDALQRVKECVGGDSRKLQASPAVNILGDTVRLFNINMNGVSKREKAWLLRKGNLRRGAPVTGTEIDKKVSFFDGTNAFQSITYTLHKVRSKGDTLFGFGVSEEYDWYDLTLDFQRAKPHSIGIGFRYDTWESASVLVDFGYNRNRLSGFKFDLSAVLNYNPRIHGEIVLAGISLASLRASYDYHNTNFEVVMDGCDESYVRSRLHTVRLFISEFNLRRMSVQVGVQNDFHRYTQTHSIAESDGQNLSTFSLYGNFIYDNMNDAYFANSGTRSTFRASLSSNTNLENWSRISFVGNNFVDLGFQYQCYLTPRNGRFTFIPQCYVRCLIGSDYDYSQYNVVGGDYIGRYVDQHLPFVGLNTINAVDAYLAILRLDLRWNIKGNHYLYAIANVMHYDADFGDFFAFKANRMGGFCGLGLRYAYKTPIGPLALDFHWSDITQKVGLYFSLGYNF